jgi:2-iminobutanoate/2-iminopropanoate deaminase
MIDWTNTVWVKGNLYHGDNPILREQGDGRMTTGFSKWIREIVSTPDAPGAIGPYSQAVAAGPLIFVSGQIGIVPDTGVLAGDNIEDQTKQAMENIAAILDQAGSGLDRILRTSVYLRDMNNFSGMNDIYGSYFDADPPARITLEASNLPLGGKVMISAVALRD